MGGVAKQATFAGEVLGNSCRVDAIALSSNAVKSSRLL